jgi:hypothetical protein
MGIHKTPRGDFTSEVFWRNTLEIDQKKPNFWKNQLFSSILSNFVELLGALRCTQKL